MARTAKRSRTAKGKRRRAKVDRISKLPDEILCNILSKLSVRDTARTSVLSTRWKHLWTQNPRLILDYHGLFGTSLVDIFKQYQFERMEKMSKAFKRAVKKIIQYRDKDLGLDSLAIYFPLAWKHARTVNRVIEFALTSHVKRLGVYLGKIRRSIPCIFPFELFSEGKGSSVELLFLSCSILSPPLNFNGFKSLKTFAGSVVIVDDIDMETILSNCQALERLVLDFCKKLTLLKITSSCLPRLKDLTLSKCKHLKKVEISSESLVRFRYRGHVITCEIRNAPNLKKSYFDWNQANSLKYMKVPQVPFLHQLEFLALNIPATHQDLRWKHFFFLQHMTLNLWLPPYGDLLWVASLLKSAPVLNTLNLQVTCSGENDLKPRELRRLSENPHNHLQNVHINGFIGAMSQIELALYILNNAKMLKLMTLDSMCAYFEFEDIKPDVTTCDRFLKYSEVAREMVEKYISKDVPSGVELCIM